MEQENFKKGFAEIKRICSRRKAWAIIEFVHKNGIKVDFIHPLSMLKDKTNALCISEAYGLYMDKDVTDEQIDAMYELVKENKGTSIAETSAIKNVKAIRVYVTISFWLAVVSALIIAVSSIA